MGMMEKMMGFMMGRMSKEEKDDMMGKMMDKFFADMTADDKKKMMAEMMPKMMMGMMGGGEDKGGMMGMMSKMTDGGNAMDMPMGPQMMMKMMPQCLEIILPTVPKYKRIDFILKMDATLMQQGYVGLTEEEKEDFVTKVIETVTA